MLLVLLLQALRKRLLLVLSLEKCLLLLSLLVLSLQALRKRLLLVLSLEKCLQGEGGVAWVPMLLVLSLQALRRQLLLLLSLLVLSLQALRKRLLLVLSLEKCFQEEGVVAWLPMLLVLLVQALRK